MSRSIAQYSGLLAPALVLGAILAATAASPTFRWQTDALSELGVQWLLPAALFNGGLVVGGVAALPYVKRLRRRGSRSVAALFALAVVAMALVGVFRIGHPLHLPAAVGFYALSMGTMLVDGLARHRQRTGRLAIAVVALHLLAWVGWLAGLGPGPGLAIPEFVGAVAFAVWIWALSPARIRAGLEAAPG